MRLCATSLLKSTAPTDGMYLKGKTRCDVGRANEDDRRSRSRAMQGRFRLHIQRWSEPKYSRNKRTRARQADDGGRRERGRVWDDWHFKYGCVPGHSSTTLQFQPEHLPSLPPPRCRRRRRLRAQAYFCKWAAAFQISVPFGAVAQTEQSRAEQAHKHRSRRLKRFAVPLPAHLDSRG